MPDLVQQLRKLKVIYFGGISIVIPPQSLRCVGWNFLLMAQCFAVRSELTDGYIADRIGVGLWYSLVLCALASGVFSLLTVFTDPGILPPINAMEADIVNGGPAIDTVLSAAAAAGGGSSGGGSSSYPRNGEYEVQSPNTILEATNPTIAQYDIGMQPFCRRCKHLRPPMTAHCWWSDVCITEMDHYCIILGVVVGARNLRWFLAYLLSIMTTSLFGIVVTFKALEVVFASGFKLMLFIAIICASLVALLATSYFFAKGTRLILAGQSTRGEIKGLATSSAAVKGWPALRHVLMPTLPSLLATYFDEIAAMEAEASMMTSVASPPPHPLPATRTPADDTSCGIPLGDSATDGATGGGSNTTITTSSSHHYVYDHAQKDGSSSSAGALLMPTIEVANPTANQQRQQHTTAASQHYHYNPNPATTSAAGGAGNHQYAVYNYDAAVAAQQQQQLRQ